MKPFLLNKNFSFFYQSMSQNEFIFHGHTDSLKKCGIRCQFHTMMMLIIIKVTKSVFLIKITFGRIKKYSGLFSCGEQKFAFIIKLRLT